MNTKLARTLAVLMLVSIIGSACGALMGPAEATQAPQQYPTMVIEAPAKEWERTNATPSPLPTATVAESVF